MACRAATLAFAASSAAQVCTASFTSLAAPPTPARQGGRGRSACCMPCPTESLATTSAEVTQEAWHARPAASMLTMSRSCQLTVQALIRSGQPALSECQVVPLQMGWNRDCLPDHCQGGACVTSTMCWQCHDAVTGGQHPPASGEVAFEPAGGVHISSATDTRHQGSPPARSSSPSSSVRSKGACEQPWGETCFRCLRRSSAFPALPTCPTAALPGHTDALSRLRTPDLESAV